MSETVYIDTVDVAKMLRKALKQYFPTVKFSIRSSKYSGGSSIRINWTNGPTAEMVEKIAHQFEGASFDGMIDLKSYHSTEINGQKVHFGSDYVFCERTITDDIYIDVANRLIGYYGALSEYPKIETVKDIFDNHRWIEEMRCSFSTLLYREIRTMEIATIQPEKTV